MSSRAVAGSNERPERESAIDTEQAARAEISPGVFVVSQRPTSLSAKLLPPLFLIVLGVIFLAYRSAVADWRGISALTNWYGRAVEAPEPIPPAPVTPTPPPTSALALNTEPVKPVEEAPEPPKVAPEPKIEIDPLADIQRESEKEKSRIAELEKMKAREEEKFAATEDQRRMDQKQKQLERRRINPQQLAQIQKMQRELILQHQELFEQLTRQQMEAMADMQQRFLGRGFPNMPGIPGPGFGFGLTPPAPRPGAQDGAETRFQRFNGHNGASGFVWQFRMGNANGPVPLPPPPGLRDDNEPAPPRQGRP